MNTNDIIRDFPRVSSSLVEPFQHADNAPATGIDANYDRYQERGLPFAAFLYRIARNAAIDRSRTLKQPLSVDELVTQPASRQNVEADAMLAVDRSILLAALTKLKTEHRDVIVMRFIEGYSALEVAAALGKTEGAVRTLQHRLTGTPAWKIGF